MASPSRAVFQVHLHAGIRIPVPGHSSIVAAQYHIRAGPALQPVKSIPTVQYVITWSANKLVMASVILLRAGKREPCRNLLVIYRDLVVTRIVLVGIASVGARADVVCARHNGRERHDRINLPRGIIQVIVKRHLPAPGIVQLENGIGVRVRPDAGKGNGVGLAFNQIDPDPVLIKLAVQGAAEPAVRGNRMRGISTVVLFVSQRHQVSADSIEAGIRIYAGAEVIDAAGLRGELHH